MVTADPKISPSAQTRATIVDCAIRLFAEQGYDGTSIRDIVEAAGVTKPVLYYYFDNKEDLFRSVVHGLYEAFLGELETVLRQPGSCRERLSALIDLYLFCAPNDDPEPYPIRLMYGTIYGPRKSRELVNLDPYETRHENMLATFFEEGIREGVVGDYPMKVLVLHFWGAVNAYLHERMMNEPVPTPETVNLIKQLLLRGIGGSQA